MIIDNGIYINIIAGWWLRKTAPLKKYGKSIGMMIPHMWKIEMFQTTNQMGKDDFSWNILNMLVSFCWDMEITKSLRNVLTCELVGFNNHFMEIPTLLMTLT